METKRENSLEQAPFVAWTNMKGLSENWSKQSHLSSPFLPKLFSSYLFFWYQFHGKADKQADDAEVIAGVSPSIHFPGKITTPRGIIQVDFVWTSMTHENEREITYTFLNRSINALANFQRNIAQKNWHLKRRRALQTFGFPKFEQRPLTLILSLVLLDEKLGELIGI